jgi:hypothetical protein
MRPREDQKKTGRELDGDLHHGAIRGTSRQLLTPVTSVSGNLRGQSELLKTAQSFGWLVA